MRLLSKILWSLAFLAATFVWMVLFEHGFSMAGFNKGVREEWSALTSMVSGSPSQISLFSPSFPNSLNSDPPTTKP